MNKSKNPMPTVEFDGSIYRLKSRKTVVPDFAKMERLSVLVWLNQNTVAKGYTRKEDVRIGGFDLV